MEELYLDNGTIKVVGEYGEVREFSKYDNVKTSNGDKLAKDLVEGDIIE